MSASSRTVQAAPGFGQLAIVFAALLVSVAIIAALAYGPLTASKDSVAPAAAPAPALAHDHGWSASSLSTAPVLHDHGWSTSARGPVATGRDSGWIDTTPIRFATRDSGWIDTTPIRFATRDSGWIDTTPIRPVVRSRTSFDKSHHAVQRRFVLVEERGMGSNRVPFAR